MTAKKITEQYFYSSWLPDVNRLLLDNNHKQLKKEEKEIAWEFFQEEECSLVEIMKYIVWFRSGDGLMTDAQEAQLYNDLFGK